MIALSRKHFFIKIQPYRSDPKKKRQRIFDLLNTETNPKKKKNSDMIEISLWPPSNLDPTPTLTTLYKAF